MSVGETSGITTEFPAATIPPGDSITVSPFWTERELSEIRSRKISFIFQGYNLIPSLSVWQNVALPMTYQGVPAAERQHRAMEALDAYTERSHSKYLITEDLGEE